MLAAFHLNLTALSYVALLVGLFLVYNTVSTSVITRREEIGTLRALGVTRGQVLALFLGEAVVLAMVGTGIGVGARARARAGGAVSLTSTTVNALYVRPRPRRRCSGRRTCSLAVLVGLPLSLVAAAMPAVEAARVPPVTAIGGADRLETRFRLRRGVSWCGPWCCSRWPGGCRASHRSTGARWPASPRPSPACSARPRSSRPRSSRSARLGRAPMSRVFGVSGLLANSSLVRGDPRLAVSVAALAVSLSMMVAIAVMIGSFRDTVVYWVGQTLKADLYVGPSTRTAGARQASISPDVEPVVRANPAVEATDTLRSVTTDYRGGLVTLNAIDFDVLLARRHLLFKAPADGDAAVRHALARGGIVVSESFSIKHRTAVGDDVELTTGRGARAFPVTADLLRLLERPRCDRDGSPHVRRHGSATCRRAP